MPEQTYHHKDLKSQLIQQGLKLFDTEGYQSFSLRKVAKLCGVSQTAPYRHFQSKDDLISAIANQALDAFAASLEGAVALHPGDPKAQLTEMGVAYIRFFAQNPEYLRLLFLTENRLRMRFFEDDRAKKHVDSYGILQDVITRFVAAHPGDAPSHDELMLFSWGLVHGISTLIASGEIPNNDHTLAVAEKIMCNLL